MTQEPTETENPLETTSHLAQPRHEMLQGRSRDDRANPSPHEKPDDRPGSGEGACGDRAPGARHSWRWGKRVGTIGFLFFLIKGLLWLLVPALIVAWQWVRSL